MTRRRRSVWLMIVALSLPAAPLLFGAQAVDEAAGEGEHRAPTAGRAQDERRAGEPRTAGETEAADPPDGRRVTRPATRPTDRTRQQEPKRGERRRGAPATTSPTTRPTKELTAEEMLSQMLKPQQAPGGRPLAPLPEVASGGVDKASGPGAVAPAAPVVKVLREGTFLVDRVGGRLSRGAEGGQAEFVFESDGKALQDPPVVIIPNLKLMQIEDAAANHTRGDLRFRISGMVTEYRGRNYVLLEKAVVVPEVLDRF